MTFIVPVDATDGETKCVTDIFDELGGSIITEERLLAAGTTLASCGIAYAMRYIRASVEGGVELGFKAKDAEKIVLQTVKGAVELLSGYGRTSQNQPSTRSPLLAVSPSKASTKWNMRASPVPSSAV